jgi:hypothetical protein
LFVFISSEGSKNLAKRAADAMRRVAMVAIEACGARLWARRGRTEGPQAGRILSGGISPGTVAFAFRPGPISPFLVALQQKSWCPGLGILFPLAQTALDSRKTKALRENI